MRTVELEGCGAGESPATLGRGGHLGTIKSFKEQLNATEKRRGMAPGNFGQRYRRDRALAGERVEVDAERLSPAEVCALAPVG